MTNDELLAFAVVILEEGAARAENYAAAGCEDDTSRDTVNEGLAFVTRFRDVYMGSLLTPVRRVKAAKRCLYNAEDDLQAWPEEADDA
jgi:hypothetical protein